MKLSFDEVRSMATDEDSVVGYFLMMIVNPDLIDNAKKLGYFEIELKINGEEIDFISAVNNLFSRTEYLVNKKAEEIVKQRIDNVVYEFECKVRELNQWVSDKIYDKPQG